MTAPSPPPSLLSAGELAPFEQAITELEWARHSRNPPLISIREMKLGIITEDIGPRLLAAYRAQEAQLADLRAQVERQAAAMQKVIDMNVQYALDRYGDASQAETMACVTVLRLALPLPPDLGERK